MKTKPSVGVRTSRSSGQCSERHRWWFPAASYKLELGSLQFPKAGGVDEKQREKGLNPEKDQYKWAEGEFTDTRGAVQGEGKEDPQRRCVCVCVCVCAKSLSHVWLFATLCLYLFLRVSRQEHWSRLPCPPPGDLPHPGIEPTSLAAPVLQVDSLLLSHWGSPIRGNTGRQCVKNTKTVYQ